MAEEKFLTIRDASLILGISEKEVIDLVESNQLPAYKVGGVYLRFKREQIEDFKKSFKPRLDKTNASRKHAFSQSQKRAGFKERISDFFYFNDFYILSALIILILLFIILRGY